MSVRKLTDVAIILDSQKDNVAVAKDYITAKTCLSCQGSVIIIKDSIKKGERFALQDIARNKFIYQYGYPFAQSKGIKKGELISGKQVKNKLPKFNMNNFKAPNKTKLIPKYCKRKFLGFRRNNGSVGTRNYYLVMPTSMCASQVALQIASNLDAKTAKYHNIDGIVAIPHTEGCGCDSGLQIDRLLSVLKGYLRHPNVGGCFIIDLGCEQTDRQRFKKYLGDSIQKIGKPVDWLTIQENGGTQASIKKAMAIIISRLAKINRVKRTPAPISKLIIGTECGASDSFSGITANPIIGNAVDKLIYAGGSVILSEVTEMLGTLPMLLPRFRTLKTAKKLQNLIIWYETIAKRLGMTLVPNLVPKNIEGGLINNYIKSLGAVMKGGTTAIEDVIEYAAPVMRPGLNIMQGPGNDPESVTGLVASGANLICFSTGKGTITADAICPVIKISSNRDTFIKLKNDMDFDASRLLDRGKTIDGLGEELFEKIIRVASGEKTWSEKWQQRQFQVWTAGKLSL